MFNEINWNEVIKTFVIGAIFLSTFIWLMLFHPKLLLVILGTVLFIAASLFFGMVIREALDE